jgi:hypothetical protein
MTTVVRGGATPTVKTDAKSGAHLGEVGDEVVRVDARGQDTHRAREREREEGAE